MKEEREFFLLQRIGGDDLPGALRTRPTQVPLAGDAPTSDDALPDSETGPAALKFSLAGIQLKFSVSTRHGGLTIPAQGEAGNWIAKLPDPRPGYDTPTGSTGSVARAS